MADVKIRAREILHALPLSQPQRDLYERGFNALDEATLEQTTTRLESVISTLPRILADARELFATLGSEGSGPAAQIQSRFLFVDVAALRAKQLRRGARVRFDIESATVVPHKAERVAMEEVRRGLVSYEVPRKGDPDVREGDLGVKEEAGSSAIVRRQLPVPSR